MSEKINISGINEETYLKLLNKVLDNKEQEREIALDRYNIAEEQMNGPEQFVLLGKNAVSYLTLVSDCTNKISDIAKEIKSIIYKEDSGGKDFNLNISGDFKKEVARQLKDAEQNKKE